MKWEEELHEEPNRNRHGDDDRWVDFYLGDVVIDAHDIFDLVNNKNAYRCTAFAGSSLYGCVIVPNDSPVSSGAGEVR